VRGLGWTSEDIERFIASATPVVSALNEIRCISDVPPIEGFGATAIKYLIPDAVPEAAITLLTGGFGCGKSSLTSLLLACDLSGPIST
jgi:hypothetical protein